MPKFFNDQSIFNTCRTAKTSDRASRPDACEGETMKVVGVSQFGGPEALRVFEVPEPHAGPGEVRVRVRAATVNPGDTVLRAGQLDLGARRPPYIPGMEAAGIVDEIGEGAVTGLRAGDAVMTFVMPLRPEGGAYAEYLALPADWVAPAPSGASHAEAAALPMNGLTARLAVDVLGLSPGQVLAVTGAAGSVGGYAVQMAKADGLRVIADAAPADAGLVRTLGADVTVPRGAGVADRFRQAAPGGADGLVDAALIGTATLSRAVRDGGGIAIVRDEGPQAADPGELARRRITRHPVFVPEYLGDQARLTRLRSQAETGTLTLRVARTFPAEQAADAHRLLEAGGTRGRMILEF
jgi:NADPH:quinone reductase